MLRTILYTVLLIMFLSVSLSAQTDSALELEFRKQNQLEIQYQDLAHKFLYPAGFGPQFDSFRQRNPKYMSSSYTRSRTADYITSLISDSKGLLEIFQECGLSQGGEYFCRNIHCKIHGEALAGPGSSGRIKLLDYYDGAVSLSAVVVGIILFVMAMGLGQGIVVRIEKRIASKKDKAKD